MKAFIYDKQLLKINYFIIIDGDYIPILNFKMFTLLLNC